MRCIREQLLATALINCSSILPQRLGTVKGKTQFLFVDQVSFSTTHRITASGFFPVIAAETKTFVSIMTFIHPDDKHQFQFGYPLHLKGIPREGLGFLSVTF